MTRFVYVLKEIRACLEAEILTNVQQATGLAVPRYERHNGPRVLHQRTFPAVDLIEQPSRQNRLRKIVKVRHVRCGRVMICSGRVLRWENAT
jgi:hypothetical protein